MILEKNDFICVRFDPARLVGSRPDRATVSVAQEDIRPPGIARAILPPACDRKVAPTAVSGARRGDHHHVSPVGKEVGAGSQVVRGGETTEDRWHKIADVRDRLHLLDSGPGDQDVPWRTFLQQQLGGLHARLGVKARAHDAVVEDVRERHERHPLVMRHIGAHHGHACILGEPRGRVIERLIQAILAARTGLR